jgi:hypothetical protein
LLNRPLRFLHEDASMELASQRNYSFLAAGNPTTAQLHVKKLINMFALTAPVRQKSKSCDEMAWKWVALRFCAGASPAHQHSTQSFASNCNGATRLGVLIKALLHLVFGHLHHPLSLSSRNPTFADCLCVVMASGFPQLQKRISRRTPRISSWALVDTRPSVGWN